MPASINGDTVFKIWRQGHVGFYGPEFEDITPGGSISAAKRWKWNKGQRITLRSKELLQGTSSPWGVLNIWNSLRGHIVEFRDVRGVSMGYFFVVNVVQVNSGELGPNTGNSVTRFTEHEWELESY
jgi:hypothetical protein